MSQLLRTSLVSRTKHVPIMAPHTGVLVVTSLDLLQTFDL